MWGGEGGVGQNIGEQEGWEQTLDLAPHSNALPYDTLLTLARVWCVGVGEVWCVCVGGEGGVGQNIGEQEGWEQTLDLAPHSNALPYDTLLTLVRVWCVCVC